MSRKLLIGLVPVINIARLRALLFPKDPFLINSLLLSGKISLAHWARQQQTKIEGIRIIAGWWNTALWIHRAGQGVGGHPHTHE